MLDFLDKKKEGASTSEEKEIKIAPYNEWWLKVFDFVSYAVFISVSIFILLMFYSRILPKISILEGIKANNIFMSMLIAVMIVSIGGLIWMKCTVLKMPKFDDWIFDIAKKHLSSEYLWYKKDKIYLDFDRNLTKKDALTFIRELSNRSEHYTYYYSETLIDGGVIEITPTKKKDIPTKATIDITKDNIWNIVPLGEAVNHELRDISPIGWWVNDNNKNDQMIQTIPSNSMLVAGGTGSGKSVLQNCIVGHISRHSDHFMAIGCDVKRVEFNHFVGVKGFCNIALTIEDVQKSVHQAQQIMMSRFEFMEKNGENNVYKLDTDVDYFTLNGKDYQFDELFTCKVDGEVKILQIKEIYDLIENGKEVEIDENYGTL